MPTPDYLYWIAIAINLVFLVISFRLAVKTNLIKDDSIQPVKPFSFGKSQLFFWTIIILSIFIWCAVFNHAVPILNSLCLGLLGISAGTTAAGALIDNSDKNTPNLLRHQDANAYKSFIQDILSDQDGSYSIHRFQSMIFNLAIGTILVWNFFSSNMKAFPDLGNTPYILGLLGISNLGYAGLKLSENSPRKDVVADLKNQGQSDAQISSTLSQPNK
jgi:hypothetical protein